MEKEVWIARDYYGLYMFETEPSMDEYFPAWYGKNANHLYDDDFPAIKVQEKRKAVITLIEEKR